MAFTHESRTGKTYYLHTDQKRDGGSQYFLSTKSSGTLAQKLPDGFEVYETVNGQVYLRRQRPKLIRDDEHQCIARRLAKPPPGHRYKVEIEGKTLTVHERAREVLEDLNWLADHGKVCGLESVSVSQRLASSHDFPFSVGRKPCYTTSALNNKCRQFINRCLPVPEPTEC